ncbi:helix-turn-helix transcriptional regulator [Demequina sp. B12]|uniref:winged helix-turn-helix transcriptional regulator n=1 Tax=Demequina sp. B12 TaxID=2992757 RepID=UPI00237ABDE1|nr:helix-turn-helix domain-containing protein [Demequina sp. B12]MDE0572287.1 helix-turn-helix transcriptional regulator [Demequina sp. B12]
MASRRTYGSYNDGCASAHALDLIGERWTLLVVRELLLGPKRFAELERDILGLSPTVLSQRLRELEERGIVERRTLPAPARVDVYGLTPWGARLEAVNAALSAWAVESPNLPWDADMSPDTLVLAMRAHARPVASVDGPVRVALTLEDSRLVDAPAVTYLATVSAEGTTVEREAEPGPVDAEIHATTAEWKACVIGGAPVESRPGTRVVGRADAAETVLLGTRLEVGSE